jgi:hypothetical protein
MTPEFRAKRPDRLNDAIRRFIKEVASASPTRTLAPWPTATAIRLALGATALNRHWRWGPQRRTYWRWGPQRRVPVSAGGHSAKRRAAGRGLAGWIVVLGHLVGGGEVSLVLRKQCTMPALTYAVSSGSSGVLRETRRRRGRARADRETPQGSHPRIGQPPTTRCPVAGPGPSRPREART